MIRALTIQRIFVVVMAAGVFGFVILPRAWARHQNGVIASVGIVLVAYICLNVWMLRKRAQQSRR